MELTPYQRDILIRTALGEARGEGAEGMADVIQVILNRAGSGQFPSDPAAVALQNKQFSTWNKGEGGNNPQQFSPNSKSYQTAAQALDAVVSGGRPDPTGGALYYHTPSVNPGWSSAVNQNGKIERNGHVFYPSHPVPPGEIPSVASLLDTRRAPPSPANLTPTAAAVRQMTSPTGGNSALQTALNNYATREANRVTPASADDRVNARNRAWIENTPATVTNVASIPSAQQLTQPGAINASVGSTQQDPILAAALARRNSVPAITPASQQRASDTALMRSANQSQDSAYRNGPVIAPIPSRSPFNGDPGTPAPGPVVATFPTNAPTTRQVPTTRVGNSSNNIMQARNEQASQRSVVPPIVRSPAPAIRTSSDIAALYAQGGPTRPNAGGQLPSMSTAQMYHGIYPQTPSPYTLGGNAPNKFVPVPSVGISPQQVAQIGLPSLAPPQITPRHNPVNRVATQLSVTQPRTAPVPFNRPMAQSPQIPARTAPVPLQRPAFTSMLAPRPQQPLSIMVQRDTPAQQPSLWVTNPMQFGRDAVNQSGDTSVGSQADAAASRSSGSGGRTRRY